MTCLQTFLPVQAWTLCNTPVRNHIAFCRTNHLSRTLLRSTYVVLSTGQKTNSLLTTINFMYGQVKFQSRVEAN